MYKRITPCVPQHICTYIDSFVIVIYKYISVFTAVATALKNSAAISKGQSTIKNDRVCYKGDYIVINILQFHS